jgi:hypothetical protein
VHGAVRCAARYKSGAAALRKWRHVRYSQQVKAVLLAKQFLLDIPFSFWFVWVVRSNMLARSVCIVRNVKKMKACQSLWVLDKTHDSEP